MLDLFQHAPWELMESSVKKKTEFELAFSVRNMGDNIYVLEEIICLRNATQM